MGDAEKHQYWITFAASQRLCHKGEFTIAALCWMPVIKDGGPEFAVLALAQEGRCYELAASEWRTYASKNRARYTAASSRYRNYTVELYRVFAKEAYSKVLATEYPEPRNLAWNYPEARKIASEGLARLAKNTEIKTKPPTMGKEKPLEL